MLYVPILPLHHAVRHLSVHTKPVVGAQATSQRSAFPTGGDCRAYTRTRNTTPSQRLPSWTEHPAAHSNNHLVARGAEIAGKHQQTTLAARQFNLVEIPRRPAQHCHPPPPPHQMAFGTLNVRSLNTRADVIKQLMSETNIQVMCLTETWHEDAESNSIKRLRASGLQVIECARPIPPGTCTDSLRFTNHGGLAVIAPTFIKMEKLKLNSAATTFEHLSIRVSSKGASCIVAVIYRPGSSPITQLFIEELESFVQRLSTLSTPFMITGDLNVRFDRANDPRCLKVNELLSAYGLEQHVLDQTHIRGGTLDIVAMSPDLQPKELKVTDVGFTDHSLVQWKTNLHVSNSTTYVTRQTRQWKFFDASKFRDDLQASFLCNETAINSDIDIHDINFEEKFDNFCESYNTILTQLLDRHVPEKTITVRVRPRTDPWYDEECREAKKTARTLERRYKRHGSNFARAAWIQSLRDSHKLVEEKRCNFWKTEVENQTNPRQVWSTIDKILCRQKSTNPTTQLTADSFATFFAKKIEDIRSTTENAPPPTFTDNPSDGEFTTFKLLDTSDVMSLIRKAPLKQCALDPIPTWLLKDCIDLLAPYITSVFNISLSSGYVPSSFKQAYITPLLKKNGLEETIVGNYRPVSNLSVLSKTLERAVHQQIENYLSEANLLPSHQSAYRKHHSTETALLKVCSDIISHLDMGDCALLAFLDLSAAFDTVDKRILLERLSRSFGIDDIALKWFQSYLTNRTEYVLFNGIKSTKRVVQFGVPQGSVLGPLLFVLYTSDLERIAEKHNLDAHFYADDSQLYIFSQPQLADSAQTRLIACLDDFAQWMNANRLKLNPDKTEFMRCATARRLPQLSKEVVTFGNSTILPATTVRNLGVVVDQKFSFQSHVNKTVSSCFYQLRRLKSSVKALPFETAKTLVNSFVISRIDYCNSILAGAPQYLLNRLQRVMNEAARMLCRCSRGDHVNRIMKERLHWLRIPQRIQFKLCLLVYKSLHGTAPTYLSELVNQVNTNDARRRLRSATIGDLIVPRTRTNFGQHAFAAAGPIAWNSLPKSVRLASSIDSFKKKLKTHFFNSI